MQSDYPTPSCIRFKGTTVPCAHCASEMRLTVLEPHTNGKLEVLTYKCPSCDRDEIFINSAQ